MEIKIKFAQTKKEKPNPDTFAFGTVFTDHMFQMDYTVDMGWHNAQIVPYEPITLDPATIVFHYGQMVFEGMKAYLARDGSVCLFRPEKNMERLNLSNDRLCIPRVDEEFLLEALMELLKIEKEWIPTKKGTSLYIRPFIFATDQTLNVMPSTTYRLMIILSPVGAYYKEGINPIKILVEDEYVRAVVGGTGTAKTAGNYAASLKAQEKAEAAGYSQVLWLDAIEKKYIEEVGSSNIFFKINGEVITPPLTGSILPGVTRDSVIQLLKHWEVPMIERKISIEEVKLAYEKGILEEVFGTGTAAVISPVGELNYQGEKMVINEGKTGEMAKKLYDTLTGIQLGTEEDLFNWIIQVK